MTAEPCRDVAFEAARRSARVNPHELWAALEALSTVNPKVIVDLWSEPAVWWAWWQIGMKVIGVSASPIGGVDHGFSGPLPSSVVAIVADPREPSTRLRVADQVSADGGADVLVLSGPDSEDGVRANFHAYAPLVREGGLVLVHGIANTQLPGIGRFWAGLDGERTELIGSEDPDGYGLVEIHERKSADHG